MIQTANYQLSQWESTDRILMADFNTDNQKIDAALKGQAAAIASESTSRQAGDLYVKLVDMTTTEALAQADFDVSAIDFTQYAEVKLYVCFNSCNEMVLRVNGETSYTKLPISGDDRAVANTSSTFLAFFDGISTNPWAYIQFNCPRPRTAVRCICITARGTEYMGYQVASGVQWSGLNTFNLVPNSSSETVPAGTRFVLYGLKL